MVFSRHLKSSRFQHEMRSEGKSEGDCVSDKFQSSDRVTNEVLHEATQASVYVDQGPSFTISTSQV